LATDPVEDLIWEKVSDAYTRSHAVLYEDRRLTLWEKVVRVFKIMFGIPWFDPRFLAYWNLTDIAKMEDGKGDLTIDWKDSVGEIKLK
jgi:hypothetical protein